MGVENVAKETTHTKRRTVTCRKRVPCSRPSLKETGQSRHKDHVGCASLPPVVPRLWSLIDSPMTLTTRVTPRRFSMSSYVDIQHNEGIHTRDAHRKIVGRVVATATRRRPRQPGWSTERDILRIGRRSLHALSERPAGR